VYQFLVFSSLSMDHQALAPRLPGITEPLGKIMIISHAIKTYAAKVVF